MPTNDFSTSGTIKVKNADGVLVPFHPKTKTDCIYDVQSSKSLTTIISELEENIEEAANSGGVKVTYDEVTDESATQYSNESMIVQIEPVVWKLKFDTKIKTANGTTDTQYIGIPFHIYSSEQPSNMELKVDWGDGNLSTLTKTNNSHPTHFYENSGIYNVEITNLDWNNTYIYASLMGRNFGAWSYPYDVPAFKQHIISIENELPTLKGISISHTDNDRYWWVNNKANSKPINSVKYLFYYCIQLQYIPSNLFINNTNITDFSYCFGKCKLKEIPEGLFDKCIDATNFSCCFLGENDSTELLNKICNSQLFTTIPENLFKYNINAVDFSYCFNACNSLNDFALHIGSPNVTNATGFCTKKTGTNRIVYVPSGSTTQTTFNNVASSLGLTIIGE